MKRPDHLTATRLGRFTGGSAVGGVAATIIPAYWLNDTTDEICGVIEGFGLTLDGNDSGQMYAAIHGAIQRAVDAASQALRIGLATKSDIGHHHIITDIDGLPGALDLKAALLSPEFKGVPTAPTPGEGDNGLRLATTAFVVKEVANAVARLVASAPEHLDTLNELAEALGNDAHFATTVNAALAARPTFAHWQSANGMSGWRRAPDGELKQWGYYLPGSPMAEGVGPTLNFPVQFPELCTGVFTSVINVNTGGTGYKYRDNYPQITGLPTQTGFTTFIQAPTDNSNSDRLDGFFWRAYGR